MRPPRLYTLRQLLPYFGTGYSNVWNKIRRGTLRYTALTAHGDYLLTLANVRDYWQQRRRRQVPRAPRQP